MRKIPAPRSWRVHKELSSKESYELTLLLECIGAELYYFRKHHRLNQRETAELLNIPQCHYSYLESGAVDLKMSTFLKLCWFLRCTPRYLMPDTHKLQMAMQSMGGYKEKRKGRGLQRIQTPKPQIRN